MTPFLTDTELQELTRPLRQASARRRYLDRLGVPYSLRPDGQPLVGRDVLSRRLGAPAASVCTAGTGPDADALQALFKGRKRVSPVKVGHGS